MYEQGAGDPVGVLDWLEENPADGRPWIGLVMIRADAQGRGFGTEAAEALLRRLPGPVRMGVIVGNEAGLALARRLGLRRVSAVARQMNAREEVVVYERASETAAK